MKVQHVAVLFSLFLLNTRMLPLQAQTLTDDSIAVQEILKSNDYDDRFTYANFCIVANGRIVSFIIGSKWPDLDNIPSSIGALTALEVLQLKGSFTGVSEEIKNCKSLRRLQIHYKDPLDLAEAIGYCTALESLSVSLTAFHDNFFNLKNLKLLDLTTGISITEIPDGISEFTDLRKFTINGSFQTISSAIGSMKTLEILTVGGHIQDLPPAISECPVLKECTITSSMLKKYPAGLCYAPSLEMVEISSGVLEEISDEIKNSPVLSELDVSGNNLSTLPATLGEIKNLDNLDISKNTVSLLPESICRASKLIVLLCSENSLTALPDSIGLLTQLGCLRLEKNNLQNLPESVIRLTEIYSCDLRWNHLSRLNMSQEVIEWADSVDKNWQYGQTDPVEIFLTTAVDRSELFDHTFSKGILYCTNNTLSPIIDVEVFNTLGKCILRHSFIRAKRDMSGIVDFNNYPAGNYFVKLISGNNKFQIIPVKSTF